MIYIALKYFCNLYYAYYKVADVQAKIPEPGVPHLQYYTVLGLACSSFDGFNLYFLKKK